MKIMKNGERASIKGPADWFTGTVWLNEIATKPDSPRVRCVCVTFEPGARTAWHTHPLGQVLHVLSGSGLVQAEGQPVRQIHPGDTVLIAPNERHWHGAGPENIMTHLALQEANAEGVQVIWMEKVTDAQYAAR
jgi:quercetin dioxygenase-like cupin family protein